MKVNSLYKKLLLSILLLLLSFFILNYHLKEGLVFHSDLGRDLYEVVKITEGNLTLLGPKVSFGGLYSSSYYFYFLAPVFWLGNGNLLLLTYFNLIFFIIALLYFFIASSSRFSLAAAALSTISLLLFPVFIFSSRSISISTTPMALLIILLTFIEFGNVNKIRNILILGFFIGIVLGSGLVPFLVLPALIIYLFSKLKRKQTLFYFLAGIFASFLPLLLFEIKNGWPMFKNTFLQKSYLSWTQNQNVLHGQKAASSLRENIVFINNEMRSFIGTHAIGVLLFTLTITLFKKMKSVKWEVISLFIAFFTLIVLLRFQFDFHYLYPNAFLMVFLMLIFLLKLRNLGLILFLVIFQIVFFPRHIYKPSTVPLEPFEQAVNYSIENKLVIKEDQFNVVWAAHPNAILGFEYRYFFQKNGYPPLSEFDYNNSKILLIFSKNKDFDPAQLNTWEAQQFGRDNLQKVQKYQTGNTYIFKAQKND